MECVGSSLIILVEDLREAGVFGELFAAEFALHAQGEDVVGEARTSKAGWVILNEARTRSAGSGHTE